MLELDKLKKFLVPETKNAISDLKKINTLLTEIGKMNSKLSKSDLAGMGSDSFRIADKYGKKAADYLAAVQQASSAGHENAADIAELSLAVQNAGNMTGDLAEQYITAADNAYQLGGSISRLTEILDGVNAISGNNAVDMAELAQGMSAAGQLAASFGLEADETTAALGTMIAATKQSGSEAANAFQSILLHIRQVTDEEKGIDAEGLTRYKAACQALNVSLTETKSGITSLREPMDVLRELSEAYSRLDSDDTRKANLLDSIGNSQNADALNALLENYSMYEKMLQEYAAGTGSMKAEAELTANSWEGSLNHLSNTWTDTIGNIADSDDAASIINSLNSVLSVINSITDSLGPLKTIGLGAGLFAATKNVGRVKCNPSQRICLQ